MAKPQRKRRHVTIDVDPKSQKNTPTLRMTALDLAVLMHHVYQGAADPEIGYLDPHLPIEYLEGSFNVEFRVALGRLERVLFFANLMNEKGKFWHPKGDTFDQFVERISPKGVKFNKVYNFFSETVK